MMEFLDIMTKPFLACVILSAIHAYIGFHVIEREVIFVDLALAQMAALGAVLGYLWGADLHSWGSYLSSSMLALAGAAIFSVTRFRKPIVPQEAIIGVVYAVAAASAVLVLSRAPEGGEELKSLLVGHLLFLDWPEVIKLALLYTLIGLFHFRFRKQFLEISLHPQSAFARGVSVRGWDFLFYASFAFVVTSSVEVAGVLLVFSLLIVPAVCGKLISQSVTGRLVSGWILSALTASLGVAGSYVLDLPTGATVVCAFGICLIVVGAVRGLATYACGVSQQ